jgi:guanylate kinase
MRKKIVLVGKSCSGKSTLAQQLESYGFKPQLSTTTRPMRDYEKQGVDYNFISEETFKKMEQNGEFVETDNFVGWYYGLTHKDFNDADILILTPRGLYKYLQLFPKENFLIIYIETSKELRHKRIQDRGDGYDNADRRWVADDLDFNNWEQWGMPWDMKISLQTEDTIPNLINILISKTKTIKNYGREN